jgi:hypothetical protein
MTAFLRCGDETSTAGIACGSGHDRSRRQCMRERYADAAQTRARRAFPANAFVSVARHDPSPGTIASAARWSASPRQAATVREERDSRSFADGARPQGSTRLTEEHAAAEALFKRKEAELVDRHNVIADYEQNGRAIREKTAYLRTLRLAWEAAKGSVRPPRATKLDRLKKVRQQTDQKLRQQAVQKADEEADRKDNKPISCRPPAT